MAGGAGHGPCPRRPLPSHDAGQDRALASDAQEPHPTRELLSAWRSRSADRGLRRNLQSPALPREPRQPDTGRRLLRAGSDHPHRTRKDQAKDHPTKTLAAPSAGRITSKPDEPDTAFVQATRGLKNSADGQYWSLYSRPRSSTRASHPIET